MAGAGKRLEGRWVIIEDDRLRPAMVDVDLGERVLWINSTDLPRSVREADIGLYESGAIEADGGKYLYETEFAGTFSYVVDTHPALGLDLLQLKGKLSVRPTTRLSFRSDSPGAKVQWGARGLQEGLMFDVQRAAPDVSQMSLRWRWWKRGTRQIRGWLPVVCDGSERIRVRVRDHSSGTRSRWSLPSHGICIE